MSSMFGVIYCELVWWFGAEIINCGRDLAVLCTLLIFALHCQPYILLGKVLMVVNLSIFHSSCHYYHLAIK